MNQQQKNTALVGAIIAGLLSLPMTWMTIRGAKIESGMRGMDGMFNAAFENLSVAVTGLNGSITLLVKTPIWFIVVVAITASALQLMRHSKVFEIPPALEWVTAILAVVWVVFAMVVALFSSQASLGIGVLLGLVCAVIPLVCLISGDSSTSATDEAAA